MEPLPENWPLNALPMADYDPADGPRPERPFGEDLVSPDSRVIPAAFCGTWAYRSAAGSISRNDVIIEAHQFTRLQAIGMQPVVAVRIISDTEIAVVSQSIENGRWLYSLNYFGLLDDGKVLIDLESMDMRWEREP